MHAGRTSEAPDTLMLHCSLARHEALLPLARAAELEALLPDLLGHGRSPDWDGQDDYHSANIAALLPLIDRPMHVLGHSFGGTLALRLAVEHPERVSRLTLIEPVFFAAARGTPAFEDHLSLFAPIYDATEAGDLMQAAQLFHAAYGAGRWSDLKPRAQGEFAARMPLVTASAPAIQEDVHDLLPRLDRITVPVTLIRGAKSQPVVVEIHARLQRVIPQAVDHAITGAGHMVPLTHVRETAGLI
ncbi:alpha/beta fold hydrolase [Salipiger sp. IMCC34102]|uniref:alpha/beta fold hydrolase n=1 Tax=Salipiger sp. IMCC34102 TaxID=2510647 RepID=UPI00101CEAE4|nr:alpha/beta fold hydrolase [Salipiger sp. IMCC34102]RYH03809.1 alpha/beta fold hydrolase [Salipiger sp. IMCC34102]